MLRKYILFIIILILSLAACTNHEQQAEIDETIKPSETVTLNQAVSITESDDPISHQTVTPVESTSTPKIIHTDDQSDEPKLITNGEILDLRWAEDSKSIQFTILLGEEEYLQSFDLVNDELILLDSQQSELNNDFPEILSLEIEDIIRYGISPSGESILYATSSEATSTPPPNDGGEFWTQAGNAQLKVIRNRKSSFIGEVNNCIDRFLWSNDETKALSISLLMPAPCMEYPAWLIDLENLDVIPILEHAKDGQIAIYNFSPDNKNILYNNNRMLYIFDTETYQSVELGLPYLMGYSQWIDNDRLLISFKKDRLSSSSIGILQLDTLEIISVLEPLVLFGSSEYRIGLSSLSPDETWIAYVKESIYETSKSLWVKRLE